MKRKFVKQFNVPLEMLSSYAFSRLIIAWFENTGHFFRAKKSNSIAAVFRQENMTFINDFNEQISNNSAPETSINLNVSVPWRSTYTLLMNHIKSMGLSYCYHSKCISDEIFDKCGISQGRKMSCISWMHEVMQQLDSLQCFG